MKIRIITIACLLAAVLPVTAQKAKGNSVRQELSQARTIIKSGKQIEKAEQLMKGLLKDSANRSNPKILLTWYDAVEGQYEAANERLYLNQKYDTTLFFSHVRRMFQVAEALDSVECIPDKHGRIRPENRKGHAAKLDILRVNLYYGGAYHIRKSDLVTAYDFFRTYIETANEPLFTGYDYAATDSLMPQVAYWATFCGYKLQQPEKALAYSTLALKDEGRREYVLQYVSEALLQKGDEEAYLTTMNEGFRSYPESPYFFPRLADYYTSRQRNDSVLILADSGLAVNPEGQLFLLAQANALLNMGRYEDAMASSQRLIELNDSMPEPYFTMGTALLNQALELERKNQPRQYRQKLRQLYSQARPYMEDYRRLAPADSRRWAPALYRIYLNLNMGRQFEEIDRVMKQ